MSSNKSLVLALCIAVTGCAQTPQSDSAATGGHWWQFGSGSESSDAGTDAKAPAPAPAPAPVAKAAATPAAAAGAESSGPWYWPFGSNDNAQAKPDAVASKPADKPAAPAMVAKSETDTKWWWPFGAEGQKDEPKALPMPDPKVTQAWLDEYEPRLRAAIKDSPFQLERREDLLAITAPVDSSFNPDRPAMLLPNTLGPITRLAKVVEGDQKTAVLILGHADTSGPTEGNQKISQERAQSVAAIFRLSGLERNRLSQRGMGAVMPRAANDSLEGRALNRRVEILMTPQDTMRALMARYALPPVAPVMVATQNVKPVAPAPAAAPAKKAAVAKKDTAKKAPAKASTAKKAAPAKTTTAAAKKPAATKASAKAPAKKDDSQASN
ncbi:OmpA family protein [Pseudomonas syringae group genomosp. 3]|uniref:OmpA family protein n=1 Tax=Pseudomonas syringae pv. tomato (strain ATCC BAA-871 / DC3000) TaxID=223283 RepID=Q87XQ9_PSESM|nr:OmpA family protein [Pseudomonas syringae group genomosp. 3]AAO57573.1 ompA family protein [Pseudomonas syringae pv. tomato str. DC3000]KKI26882.1 membrane protein [Pseudomonas syringae pv. persicae]KPB90629.1 OmpA family protein [Pseudomonas syringae pv. maculicola]MBF9245373.1 OmpA family protein [Pseudomonas syringae pv. tomato]MBW8024416.1 OmpA family protein [Pseudomonas syringae pv. tomato]